MSTADPLNPSGPKIGTQKLQQEAVDQQGKFDQQAAQIQAERQSILDDYQAQADSLKNKFQASASKLSSDTAAYNTAVTTFNQKLTIAGADLQAQADRNSKLVQLGSSAIQAVGTGLGPMGLAGTAVLTTALGGLVGVWRDSAAKSQTLAVKNQQIAQLTAAANSGTVPPALVIPTAAPVAAIAAALPADPVAPKLAA